MIKKEMNIFIIAFCIMEVVFSMGITACCCFAKFNEAASLGICVVALFFACAMAGIFDD